MSKQDTADSDVQKVLKLIGKPTPDTQYKATNNPAIIKLLKFYDGDTKKVYNFYDILTKLGWIDHTYGQFTANVRKNRERIATTKSYEERMANISPDDTTEIELTDEQLAAAAMDTELACMNRRYQAIKKELNELKVSQYMQKEFVNELREELSMVKPDKFSVNIIKPKKTVNDGKKYYSILPISDVHYGEVVNPREINELNAYDTDIAKRRQIELFKRNYEYSMMYGCTELNIFLLGDLFSGNIHAELRESNEMPVTRCIAEYHSFIIGLIDTYKDFYEKVNISCVVGNHARTTDKYQFKHKGIENYEYILYSFIESWYKDDEKVNVRVGESTVLFSNVGNQVWKLEHGDRYKGGSAFVSPLSTTVRDNFKDQGMYSSQKFDAVIMGHWHIGGEWFLPGTSTPIYMNPSIVGPGEYSIHNLHSAFPASSYLFVTDGNEVVGKRFVNLMDIR